MAIECVHIYPYKQLYFDKGLDLPLRDYSRSQLAITNIEGLGPVDANINITPFAARDGGLFNSSRKQQRNITLTMKLFNDPSMESVREKIYSACPVGEPISLVFDYSDGYSKTIDGYVENNPVDYFGENEGIQVSIICPDPDLKVVYKGSEEYTISVNYKMINYPAKQIILDIGNELSMQWEQNCKDETELYNIDSILKIQNLTGKNQKCLFAFSLFTDIDSLSIDFIKNLKFENRNMNEYIAPIQSDEFESDTYYYITKNGYVLITDPIEFNFKVQKYIQLQEFEEFVPNIYYRKIGTYEVNKWLKVTWDADYSDQGTDKYGYPVKYAFLSSDSQILDTVGAGFKYVLKTGFDLYIPSFYYEKDELDSSKWNKVESQDPPSDFYIDDNKYYRMTPISGNEVYASNILLFESEASYFTSESQMFLNLSYEGHRLAHQEAFVPGIYYKKVKEFIPLNITNNFATDSNLGTHMSGGWMPVSYDDRLYFIEHLYAYKYKNGYFNPNIPLYAIYRTNKVYISIGTKWESNVTYYYINSEGNEVSVHGTQPADFGLVSSKYYRKNNIYEAISNYPQVDDKVIDNRSRYDIILDFLGFTYDPIDPNTGYEPNRYYEYYGMATTDINGLYGIEEIPIYHMLTGTVPYDWNEASNKYFKRRRRTQEEKIYDLYINDHAYYNKKNKRVYEYEPLVEEPSDWDENYENYYYLEKDFSNIVAYFSDGGYLDYSKTFNKLEIEPEDWNENYENYYYLYKDFTGIAKKVGDSYGRILPEFKNEDLISSLIFLNTDDGICNYIFGDINANETTYELRLQSDPYKPGVYYSYDQTSGLYSLVTSSEAPEDFYTDLYKYYKKVTKVVNYIPKNVVIFYNPFSNSLEYDMDQYTMFLTDFPKWFEHVSSDILKIYRSNLYNDRYIRKNDFITYKLPDSIIQNGIPYLISGKNDFVFKSIKDGIKTYNEGRIIAIASVIE